MAGKNNLQGCITTEQYHFVSVFFFHIYFYCCLSSSTLAVLLYFHICKADAAVLFTKTKVPMQNKHTDYSNGFGSICHCIRCMNSFFIVCSGEREREGKKASLWE